MFNERDRRCAAVQLMLSTDPSYDNRTIASTLKMQIRTVQRAQGDENKVSGYGYGLWCGFKWGPHHATSHLRSRLESQHQSVPGCAKECGDLLVQSGGRWQTVGVAAGLGAGTQVQREPGLASEGVLRLCTLLSLAPLLSRPEPAGLLRLVIRREHHQRDLRQHQSQPDRCHPPSSLVEKACSQFRIRIKAAIEAEGGGYIEYILHNQVTWIDSFNKSLK